LIFAGLIGGLYDFIIATFGWWGETISTRIVGAGEMLAEKAKIVLKVNTGAAVLGLGYIIGLKYSLIICAILLRTYGITLHSVSFSFQLVRRQAYGSLDDPPRVDDADHPGGSDTSDTDVAGVGGEDFLGAHYHTYAKGFVDESDNDRYHRIADRHLPVLPVRRTSSVAIPPIPMWRA